MINEQQIDMKTQYPEGAPRWAVHRIEIDLVAGGYKGTVVKEVGGNCKGGDLLEGLVEDLCEDFEPNMSIAERQALPN